MANDERAELVDHLNRCRELLTVTGGDTIQRRTVSALIGYLESKLKALDQRVC